jgi:hypothetical protein
VLRILGAHCARLEEIFVQFMLGPEVSEGWVELAQGCPQLTTLETKSALLTEDDLCYIVQSCRNLQTLEVDESIISDRAMYAIAQHCKNLRNFEVTTTGAVTDAGLCAVAAACPKLRVLVIGTACSDVTLTALAEHCTDLRSLYLSSPDTATDRVTDLGVTVLVSGCTKLRVLWLGSVDISDAILPVLADKCKLLRELHICDCGAVNASQESAHRLLFDADVLVDISD